MIKDRLPAVQKLLADCGLDAFVFTDLFNIRYLAGFTGTDGVLLATSETDVFLTDSRYTTQARQQVAAAEIREYAEKFEGITDCLKGMGARRIGFEGDALAFGALQKLKEKSPQQWEWVPVERKTLSFRACKGSEEIAALEEAARLNAEAFAEILPLIRPGAIEQEIALELEIALKRRGGEEKAFDFIVASGVRGAMPHGIASQKAICAGELVTIDFGTRFRGYHSDETVTVAVGEVSPQLRRIYDTVHRAQSLALEKVRPGTSLKDIDAAARNHIAEEGFGPYFGHGLGHGVGLEVHESPVVSTRSEEVAREGMVFTIEPGIYVPDLGGVRLEDTVLVTAEGCRRLTRIPKEYQELPV